RRVLTSIATFLIFCQMMPRSLSSTLFPYTTLFRSVEDLLDDERGEPQRRLVEQEQLRPRHQRAADRQHLLLAARQRAAALHAPRSEEHTSELQSRENLVCRLLLEKKKQNKKQN